MTVFSAEALQSFVSAYPGCATKLGHSLLNHPLLEPDRLALLGERLPADQVEYNLGNIDVSQPDPAATPANGLTVAETLANIDRAGSWVALRNIETDPDYRGLMMDCLSPILPLAENRTGRAYRPEGFIFASSPGAVTPFHFDPEHNILLQVRGQKTLHLFPADDPAIVSARQHEAYHAGGHCNLAYDPAMETKATAWPLLPGDALYVPVKAPHWVQNGDQVSISLSITWRSEESDRQRRIYRLNRLMRRGGLNPPPLRVSDPRIPAKDFTARVLDRLGML
ncbi:cupin-like domain-containing protein [Aquisalinus flavus]|uniref:JmjC domain-containing protein n=1 Tax=Aquisalinus flavus TaxID=1526572 RepID=A0A8J2V2D4_9PROT|nr:cupin-like domain-containing protein [Aquisalinus flavus]MBD0426341.1 cupin-like domain-containing protein [Aquisalinus flavus]UNE48093.1 transcriptional regulator [Aquisalinus flavus]GGD08756.1 hypothetical protein GCM10011342_16960 [Aquisalinus flavus]